MKKKYCFILATIILISGLAMGQEFTNIKVNHITGGTQNTDGGNSIAIYGNNVYLFWSDFDSTFFSFVSKSTDGGVTFSDGVKVGEDDPQIFGSITTDNVGNLYAAWSRAVGEIINGIYFSKSADSATTFSTPLTVTEDGVFPQISVQGSYIYILFYKPKEDNKAGFFFVRSTNGGTSFETPYEITDAVIDNVKLDAPCNIFCDNTGNIFCIWNDNRRGGTGTDIYMAKSTDNGASFSTNILVNDEAGSVDKMRTGPSLAVYDSYVFVTWRQEEDDQGNNRKILFTKSTNSGDSFELEKEIASGGFGSPSLAINSSGEIYIAYPQYTTEQNGLFCTKSNDYGNTFPVTTFINSVNGDGQNPSITIDANDVLHSVWNDNRSGDDDVYYAKGTITITGTRDEIVNTPVNFKLLQNYPNPFNPVTTIKYQIPKESFVSVKVYDAIGNEVADLVNEQQKAGYYGLQFDASSLSSGIYFYRIISDNYTTVKKMLLLK